MKKTFTIISICWMFVFTSKAQTWSAVGSGLNGTVNSLYNDTAANRLYATGAFTGKVAYWNGTTWNVIPGYPGTFDGLCIATHGTDVIVGSDSIYVYNGTNWYTVSGLGATNISGGYGFKTICWYPPCANNGFNDYIYFGAKYFAPGATSALVQCDPSNNYSATQIGPNLVSNLISDLGVYNNTLYVVGNFPGFIEKYTTSLSPGTTSSVGSGVNGVETYGSDFYFGGGNFTSLNGVSSTNFIKYNTSFITTGGLVATTGPMKSYSGNLYVANGAAPGMKVWNGTSSINIASAIGQTIYALEVYQGDLYAAGTFTTPYANIAKYNDGTTTSVKEDKSISEVSIYPNPAHGKISISNPEIAKSIEITDVAGKSVLLAKPKSNLETINIENLSKGVYFVKVTNSKGVITKKFLIE